MNIYRATFIAMCPSNGARVQYHLEIEVPAATTIRVEEINEALLLEEFQQGYHEEFADQFAARFPGKQTLRAHHHGVDIETIRTGATHD